MEVTIQTLAWLKRTNIIKGVYKDNIDKVLLNEEDSARLELGLITPMIRMVYTGQIPEDSEFRMTNTSSSRLYNWNMLVKPLEIVGIEINSDIKALIVAGDRMQVMVILENLTEIIEKPRKKKKAVKTTDGSLLLNNIDSSCSLEDSESVLEFLLLGFCKAFRVTPKVAAGLLTQKCSFLSQIVGKGLKGSFEPVLDWLDIMMGNISIALRLVENEQSGLQLFFSCFRTGIFSKKLMVNVKTAETMVAYHTQMKYLEASLWEWFLAQSDMIYAIFKLVEDNKSDMGIFLTLLYTFSKKNLDVIFNFHLQDYCKTTQNYIKFISLCVGTFSRTHYAQFFFNQGLIDIWADISLRESEKDPKNLDRKSFYINFICEIWSSFSNIIELKEELGTNMLAVIKRSTREASKVLKFIIYGRLFHLLNVFTTQKTSFAPIVYKTLAFFLIENYADDRIREFLLGNFKLTFSENENIPLSILLEPLIKQSQVSKTAHFNLCDFDFYYYIAQHPRLSIKDAVLLLDLLGKILLDDWFFSPTASIVFFMLVEKFIGSVPVFEFVLKYVAIALKLTINEFLKYEKKTTKVIKNSLFGVIEKIVLLRYQDLNLEIRYLFDQNSEELKKQKDLPLDELYRLFGMSHHREDDSFKSEKVPLDDDKRVVSIYTVPKGRVMSDLEKVRRRRLEKELREKEESKKKAQNEVLQKKTLKKQIEKRRIELGVKSKAEDGEIPIVTASGESEDLALFGRIQDELPEEQAFIEVVRKKFSRVIKALFVRYAGVGYKKSVVPIVTFDKIQITRDGLSETDFSRMLRENNVSSLFISTEEIRTVFATIASKTKSVVIHFELFTDLLYMVSMIIFSRHPYNYSKYPPCKLFENIFLLFRPCDDNVIPRYLFDEPDPGSGDRDVIRILNQILEKNPDYQLPENYKKYKEPILTTNFTACSTINSYNIAIEIIDSILNQNLNLHILMPIVKVEYKTRAKGMVKGDDGKNSYRALTRIESNTSFAQLSPFIKLSSLNIFSVGSEIVIECAKVLDDLIYSIEKNSFVFISKHAKPPGSITNKVLLVKQNKVLEKNLELEKAEHKRKNRMAIIEEELSRLRGEKEIKKYIDEEQKKKDMLKVKFTEKKIKEIKEKQKFMIEERLLEYRLAKLEQEIKNKDKRKPIKNLKMSERKVHMSVDAKRPRSIETSPIGKSSFKD